MNPGHDKKEEALNPPPPLNCLNRMSLVTKHPITQAIRVIVIIITDRAEGVQNSILMKSVTPLDDGLCER